MKKNMQTEKIYLWEDEVIQPRSKRLLNFNEAQSFVNGVWLAHGWLYPPEVTPLPAQTRRHIGRACRHGIQIHGKRKTPAWVLVHEIAHALTDDNHGPNFVGMYIKVLEKTLDIPVLLSVYSLNEWKIKFNLAVKPAMLDPDWPIEFPMGASK